MNDTKPKQMVSKNVAIALGIICVVLVALIAYFTVTGISAQNSYNNLQKQNNQLQANNTNLQNQVNDLTKNLNLGYSTLWLPEEQIGTPYNNTAVINASLLTTIQVSFAGYVQVRVDSTSANSYVRMIWSSNGVNYDNQIWVGDYGTAVFPILPTTNLEIDIGNANNISALYTIMITYYY